MVTASPAVVASDRRLAGADSRRRQELETSDSAPLPHFSQCSEDIFALNQFIQGREEPVANAEGRREWGENHFALAEEAYRLVVAAWLVISVPALRALLDEELKMNSKFRSGSETHNFFWTMYPYCYYVYEYPMVFRECWNEICRSASDVVAMGKFLCAGFVQGLCRSGLKVAVEMAWTPFSTPVLIRIESYNFG
nr:DnaJ domain protein [Ipomoea batatas]